MSVELAGRWRVNGWRRLRNGMAEQLRTDVVLTPQSKSDEKTEGAGGVSIHSKVSSEVVPLILLNPGEFCKTKRKGVVFSRR
jgi:hypothetical protein